MRKQLEVRVEVPCAISSRKDRERMNWISRYGTRRQGDRFGSGGFRAWVPPENKEGGREN